LIALRQYGARLLRSSPRKWSIGPTQGVKRAQVVLYHAPTNVGGQLSKLGWHSPCSPLPDLQPARHGRKLLFIPSTLWGSRVTAEATGKRAGRQRRLPFGLYQH
jgi:hypothetical protein